MLAHGLFLLLRNGQLVKACNGGPVPVVCGMDIDPCAAVEKSFKVVVAFKSDSVFYQERFQVPYLVVRDVLGKRSVIIMSG